MPQEDQRPGDRNMNRMRPRDENGAPEKDPNSVSIGYGQSFSPYWSASRSSEPLVQMHFY